MQRQWGSRSNRLNPKSQAHSIYCRDSNGIGILSIECWFGRRSADKCPWFRAIAQWARTRRADYPWSGRHPSRRAPIRLATDLNRSLVSVAPNTSRRLGRRKWARGSQVGPAQLTSDQRDRGGSLAESPRVGRDPA